METKTDSTVLASAIAMVESQLGRNNEARSKNRNLAIVVVGAIIGFSVQETDASMMLMLGLIAATGTVLFWYQDYQLHKWQHGWQGVRKRIRRYIRGEIKEEKLRLLQYCQADEGNARLFSKSSSFLLVLLAIGAFIVTCRAMHSLSVGAFWVWVVAVPLACLAVARWPKLVTGLWYGLLWLLKLLTGRLPDEPKAGTEEPERKV